MASSDPWPPEEYASPIELGILRIVRELDEGHYSTVHLARWCQSETENAPHAQGASRPSRKESIPGLLLSL